jgi:xanthine dehydrogenase YagS FAD-binding subunit
MCVAMAALDAKVEVEGPKVKRTISFAEFHKLPGAPPWIETTLRADELIVSVTLPPPKFAKNAYYLKARDRNSYAFALISVAAGLEMDGEHVRSADLALGGVALKPWRRVEAEKVLVGKPVGAETFTQAAEILLQGAKGYEHNAFKIELAKQGVVRALTLASQGTTEGVQA